MKRIKMNVFFLLGLIVMMVTACSQENEEPVSPVGNYGPQANVDEELDSEQSFVWPFIQVTVLLHNYGLNTLRVFFTLPSVNPFNPTVEEVGKYLYDYPVGVPFTWTQMMVPGLERHDALYSCYDATHPIILVSAWGGEMKVRCMPLSAEVTNVKTTLFRLEIPDENGGFRDMTPLEQEFFGYAYEEEGDWQILAFPENHTDDFRVVSMTVDGEYELDGTWHELYASRSWIFVQLPWTDDIKIFDNVPMYTMTDLIR